MIKKISIPCPWCQAFIESWQIGDQDDDTYLPSFGDTQTCESCKNHLVVKDIEVPKIVLERGRSKEQDDLDRQAAKDQWKTKIAELRKRYPKVKSPTFMCQILGHKWECLATSGYVNNATNFTEEKFLVCVKCLWVVDSLREEPQDYGYYVRL